MATDPRHTMALDQLQREIGLILQHTGQMFASSTKQHGVPEAHALRLKREIPDSMARFNDALDCLESDIQMAQAAMRRDLAVCLEKADRKPQTTVVEKAAGQAEAMKSLDVTDSSVEPAGGEDAATDDAMVVDPPGFPQEALPLVTAEKPKTPAEAQPESEESPDPLAGLEHELGAARSQQSSKQDQLHVDTKPANNAQSQDQSSTQEQPDPNTALTHANTDLDSLFGGPMSATTTTGPTNPFSPDAQGNNNANSQDHSQPSGQNNNEMNADFDFDFTSAGDFSVTSPNANNNPSVQNSNSNSNDALSALIPGLQEYANEPPSQSQNINTTISGIDGAVSAPSDLDFNNLFGDIANSGGGGDGGEMDMDMGAGGSFDELMDFAEFDSANFGSGTGNGGDGNGNGEDLNFDFNFD